MKSYFVISQMQTWPLLLLESSSYIVSEASCTQSLLVLIKTHRNSSEKRIIQ